MTKIDDNDKGVTVDEEPQIDDEREAFKCI